MTWGADNLGLAGRRSIRLLLTKMRVRFVGFERGHSKVAVRVLMEPL